MNNEDFVSYEIAVKLKELGFNWKINNAFSKKLRLESLSIGEVKDVYCKIPKNFNDNRKGCGKGIDFYSRPSLAQAQKWLREERHWHIQVRINGCRNMFSVEIWEMKPNGYCKRLEQSDGHVRLFDRYEDALNEGVSETLKLIEEESI